MAAGFQEAVVDVLVTKARRAAQEIGAKGLVLGGGVAANSLLRERFLSACVEDGIHGFLPSRAMCTDNAAMVAAAAWWRLGADGPSAPRPRRRPQPASLPAARLSRLRAISTLGSRLLAIGGSGAVGLALATEEC